MRRRSSARASSLTGARCRSSGRTPSTRRRRRSSAGITQIEAENVVATILAGGAVRKCDMRAAEPGQGPDLQRHQRDRAGHAAGGRRMRSAAWTGCARGWPGARVRQAATRASCGRAGMRPPRGRAAGRRAGLRQVAVGEGDRRVLGAAALPAGPRQRLRPVRGSVRGAAEGGAGTADHVAPCVLWIDEIEKGLAGGGSDSRASTSRLVGQFLYWLQESSSARVRGRDGQRRLARCRRSCCGAGASTRCSSSTCPSPRSARRS